MRDQARGEAAAARIAQNGSAPQLLVADLSSQADVRRLADEILASRPRIDVLINNAGGMFSARECTIDGLERTFALNHMAYFLLTNLLLDRTSRARRRGSFRCRQRPIAGPASTSTISRPNATTRVGRSTRALAARLEGTGVTANCLHPGFARTRFFDQIGGWFGVLVSVMQSFSGIVERSQADTSSSVRSRRSPGPLVNDAVAERLWLESLRLAGLKA